MTKAQGYMVLAALLLIFSTMEENSNVAIVARLTALFYWVIGGWLDRK